MVYTPSAELESLAVAACSGELTDDGVARLEVLLRDPAACRWWRDACLLQAELRFLVSADRADATSQENLRTSAETIASVPLAGLPISTSHGMLSGFAAGWPAAYLVATVVFGVGLVVGALVHVSKPAPSSLETAIHALPQETSPLHDSPQAPSVGRITGMADCVWEGTGFRVQGSATLNRKSLVHLGDLLALKSGLLEITYNTGARVILQGPVTYEVESAAGGFLSLGKLTAKLEKQLDVRGQRSVVRGQRSEVRGQRSESANHQFVVRTPTAIVTDLGTEFGVHVDAAGTTESYVFLGSIRVQALAGTGKPQGSAQTLQAHESARVEGGRAERAVIVDTTGAPAKFIRALPKLAKPTITLLDLVDVVAGGDGHSERRNRGIDPTTGQTTVTPLKDPKDTNPADYIIVGDRQYHRVKALPMVDGVFIPDGRLGAVQVDSAGHTCSDFSNTTGTTGLNIWAGGEMPMPDPYPPIPTTLGSVDYASRGHGLLFLHANNGITFDLDAIRRANPGCRLVRFRAVMGNVEASGKHEQDGAFADAWVIADGSVRFKRREITNYNSAVPINIAIEDNARFLTLASTDGGNGIHYDWILFGDPRLELSSIKPRSEEPVAREEEKGGGPTSSK
jgi:hypothetical protein